MKTLTPEQKLEVIRGAKKLYLEVVNNHSNPNDYPVMCGCLAKVLYRGGFIEDVYNWRYADTQATFPEMLQYKPEGVHRYDLWWPREDVKTRLEVFDELEIEYMAQIGASFPWYTKLFNKIKNLFSWKRN